MKKRQNIDEKDISTRFFIKKNSYQFLQNFVSTPVASAILPRDVTENES